MSNPITFHTRPWTLRDALMTQRLERNPQDIEALVALLVSRSDATVEEVMALPITALDALAEQLAESLKIVGVTTALSMAWNIPDGEAGA